MKPIIGGNWKMNKTESEAVELAKGIVEQAKGIDYADIVICPNFTCLSKVKEIVSGTNISLGAQNMHHEDSGAFTGETSSSMLKDVGCEYVILGHSERRHVFGEDDGLINKKVKKALSEGFNVIFCVGEKLEQREAEKTSEVLDSQVEKGLNEVQKGQLENLVIAYEPVWAIGTGKTATPEQAQEAHAHIRKKLSDLYGDESASEIRIQYGGSMKPENANELLSQKDVNGGLIGGASLKPDSFIGIVKACE